MDADYPFDSITINRREVLIKDIVGGKVLPDTAFEKSTFEFIGQWFSNAEEFHVHTSGSTGKPKPIVLRREQLEASAKMTANALGLRRGDTALAGLDTRYIAGQMMLVRSFTTGMRLVATQPEANPFRSVPNDVVIDFTALVPYHVYKILDDKDEQRIQAIRNILIGGAPLASQVAELISSFRSSVYLTYGMTETISHVALHKLTPGVTDRIFTTLPGVNISTDERGCLVIRAGFLDTEQVTNDLVEMLDSTHFRWVGRIDNVINSGGVKISPETVEPLIEISFKKLNLHARFVISGMADEKLGAKVVLVMEGKSIDEALKNTLFKHLESMLKVYERPKKILVLPVFPQTDTGKIRRNEIARMISERPQN